MRVILSTRAAWAVTNDADVAKNVRTASMMTKKSQMDIEIYYGDGDVVLSPATSKRAFVLGVEGFGGTEDAEAMGNGAVVAGAGTEDAGT